MGVGTSGSRDICPTLNAVGTSGSRDMWDKGHVGIGSCGVGTCVHTLTL